VRQLMSSPIISCHSSDRIDAVLATMTLTKIRHVPVIDAGSTKRSWKPACCWTCRACTPDPPASFDVSHIQGHRARLSIDASGVRTVGRPPRGLEDGQRRFPPCTGR
jgi:CBS domain-containing protein